MRDPARIDLVLSAIREVWLQHPDMRLGQLLINAVRPSDPCPELFSLEDAPLVSKVGKLADRLRRSEA